MINHLWLHISPIDLEEIKVFICIHETQKNNIITILKHFEKYTSVVQAFTIVQTKEDLSFFSTVLRHF